MAIVSTELQGNMESFASDVTAEVIEKLSKKYEFDVDEAKEFMGIVPAIMQAPKAPKAPKAPIIPLPFCGVVKEDWCQAIQCNYNLYSQCRKEKLDEGDFCKACKKKADNNDGKTPYGLIQERLDGDYKNNKGKSPTNYGNVMKKRDITREMAEAEAEKVGFTIPEEQFEVIVATKGRKPNPKDVTKTSPNKKKLGRPAKNTEQEEDMVLMAKRKAEKQEQASSDDDSTKPPKKKVKQVKRVKKVRKVKKDGKKKKPTQTLVQDTSSSSEDEEDIQPLSMMVTSDGDDDVDKNINKECDESKNEDELTSDDESSISNELLKTSGVETTPKQDLEGNLWYVDDEEQAYDENEIIVGIWDEKAKKVIPQEHDSESDESDCDEWINK